MAVVFTFEGLTSIGAGSAIAKLGRNRLLLLTFVFDMAHYTFLFIWTPTPENSWIIYPIAVVYGSVRGFTFVTLLGISSKTS